MFKIMAEFVEGFERLEKLTLRYHFWVARTRRKCLLPANYGYIKGADEGFGIITGGGPGIWRLAIEAHVKLRKSVGLNIELPFEQEANSKLIKINPVHRYLPAK